MRPRAKTGRDRGDWGAPAQAGLLEPERTRTGTGRGGEGDPVGCGAGGRARACSLRSQAQAQRGDGGPPPVEAAQLPPASRGMVQVPPGYRGSGSAPSWLPWALAAHFHLPRKPYSSRESSVAPGDSCRSSKWLTASDITRWATSIYMNLVKRSRKEEDQQVLGREGLLGNLGKGGHWGPSMPPRERD